MLAGGRVHVMDGAMGTMLYARGVFVNVCYDELNATRPELVEDVHEQYVRAGAEVVETNTFGANPVKLSAHGLDERTEELNERAARIAGRASAGRTAVAGAIGPLGVRVEPLGPTSLEEARAYFARQAEGLLEGGVDGFVLETFSDLAELEQAARAVMELCSLPVIAHVTVGEDGATANGATVEQAARAAGEWGVAATGLNCSVGPAAVLDGIERMAEATSLPLAAQPNAGMPRAVGDRKMYMAAPEYMALYARRVIAAGARFVGGCCGTTPEHVRRMRDEVARVQPRTPVVRATRPAPPGAVAASPVPLAERSELGRSIAAAEFVRSVRIRPPAGWAASRAIRDGRDLAHAGVRCVAVREDRSAPRMSAAATAALLAADGAVEPIVHYTCRDRKLADIIADLLGMAASGVRNVVLVTGDPAGPAPYPEFDSVLDVDSIGLANVVAGLNAGADPAGNSIGEPTEFVVGAALNQGARDFVREAERLRWKEEAGVHFAVTRPVFDPEQLMGFLGRAGPGLPVVASVQPLASARQAEFLQNEVAGVHVPDHVVERMRAAEGTATHGGRSTLQAGACGGSADGRDAPAGGRDRRKDRRGASADERDRPTGGHAEAGPEPGAEAAQREGWAIAAEVVRAVAPEVAGVQVVAGAGGIQEALAALRAARDGA